MTGDSQTNSLSTIHRMIYPSIPTDKDWQAEFGILAIHHEYLKYEHQMTYKSLKNLSIEEALEKTKYWGYKKLRDEIKKSAENRLGDCKPLTLLEDLLNRAEGYTEKRNEYIHSLYGKQLDGDHVMQNSDGDWGPIPKLEDLKSLHTNINKLTEAFRKERFEGYLFEAIQKTK